MKGDRVLYGGEERTSRASVYDVKASCSFPTLNAWLPSSFNRSTSFTRLRRRCAGSWPGSYRSADCASCSAWGSRPQRKSTSPRSVSKSGEFDCSRSASLSSQTSIVTINNPSRSSKNKQKQKKVTTYLTALFAPSQFARASSISIRQTCHSTGISLPSASTPRKHRSSTTHAMAHSPRRLAASKFRTCASSSSARSCICAACALPGSADSTPRSVESAATVCASASWQRARRRRVLAGGETGVAELAGEGGAAPGDGGLASFVFVLGLVVGLLMGLVGGDWRETACWQSTSAGRKRLMAI